MNNLQSLRLRASAVQNSPGQTRSRQVKPLPSNTLILWVFHHLQFWSHSHPLPSPTKDPRPTRATTGSLPAASRLLADSS